MPESFASTQRPGIAEASSSSENPEKNPTPEITPLDKGKQIAQENYFSFFVKPAYKLKRAIAVLAETDLNPKAITRIDASNEGFEMTVYDKFDYGGPFDEVYGLLTLNPKGLIDFECSGSVTGMISTLDGIDEFLRSADDNDVVKVLSLDGNQICFQYMKRDDETGVPQWHRSTTKFKSTIRLLKKFPTVLCAFEIVLSSKKLKPLLTAIMTDISNGNRPMFAQAKVDISVRIQAGGSRVKLEKTGKERMWFLMTSWSALEKASLLSDTCKFYLVKKPGEHIMLRYSIEKLGDLIILKSTQECFSDGLQPILRTYKPHT